MSVTGRHETRLNFRKQMKKINVRGRIMFFLGNDFRMFKVNYDKGKIKTSSYKTEKGFSRGEIPEKGGNLLLTTLPVFVFE